MARTSFLGDMLNGLFEVRRSSTTHSDQRSIEDMCLALLANEGEVSGFRLSKDILTKYADLTTDEKHAFFNFLNSDLELDVENLTQLAQSYSDTRSIKSYRALATAAEPKRQELLRRLNQSTGATALLVDMRVDLLDAIKINPDLKRTDSDFIHLLRSWFNRGFLMLNQISWNTPAAILDKVVDYEAVHAINDLDDLKGRLYPPDRRCFAYFHPSMPGEPLIFVEVALMATIPSSIQEVLADERDMLDAHDTKVAAFYSISNCQKGLHGISFGNLLIKQVVAELKKELPQLDTFVTLSPIPGLNSWIKKQDTELAKSVVKGAADDDVLLSVTAHYLADAKDSKGRPVDPVARFHLGNGAEIYDIHAQADTTENGLAQSSGAMVNYLYNLKNIEKNHEHFVSQGGIARSRFVAQKLKTYQAFEETVTS